MEGIRFGLIDNGIMIIGAIFGLSVEKYLPKYFHRGWGAIAGAGIGNAMSDFLGELGEGNVEIAFGTFIGCTIALILIPIFKLFKKK